MKGLKKSFRDRCFPLNFAKYLRTLFYRIFPVAPSAENQQVISLVERSFPCQSEDINKFMTKQIYYMCGIYLYVIIHHNSTVHEIRNDATLTIQPFTVS